jgi:hypothetical protein
MKSVLKGLVFIATLWIGSLLTIAIGYHGALVGPLLIQAQEHLQLEPMQQHGINALHLNTPPGTVVTGARDECVPNSAGPGCPKQLVLDYTDASGQSHEVVITHLHESGQESLQVIK